MISNMLKKNKKGFTLVELMIVVAIIGILAALAIPAFMRYIKSTKVAEGEPLMKKITDGAKGYMTSEQKYSAATGGDQPWHPDGGTPSTQPGLPVIAGLYVFPGGAGLSFNTTAGVGTGIDIGSAPKGGSKQVPFAAGVAPLPGSAEWAMLNKLNVTLQDPLYFQYAYVTTAGQGYGVAGARLDLTATADFNTGSATAHTLATNVTTDDLSQEVVVAPTVTTFEFE